MYPAVRNCPSRRSPRQSRRHPSPRRRLLGPSQWEPSWSARSRIRLRIGHLRRFRRRRVRCRARCNRERRMDNRPVSRRLSHSRRPGRGLRHRERPRGSRRDSRRWPNRSRGRRYRSRLSRCLRWRRRASRRSRRSRKDPPGLRPSRRVSHSRLVRLRTNSRPPRRSRLPRRSRRRRLALCSKSRVGLSRPPRRSLSRRGSPNRLVRSRTKNCPSPPGRRPRRSRSSLLSPSRLLRLGSGSRATLSCPPRRSLSWRASCSRRLVRLRTKSRPSPPWRSLSRRLAL
ncbi:hypothetical protein SAMN04489730_8627 [Amycolatopsis australiensis]|uniref:Uncharacterized protein n=1 Tax=Amycolatopsis australiensis TaxID=546364 RepID=A0A1K1T8S7_9PSEU|nr:hypothetical protein SAMN04489730_8627 [Amycolatopsis australiensis]